MAISITSESYIKSNLLMPIFNLEMNLKNEISNVPILLWKFNKICKNYYNIININR